MNPKKLRERGIELNSVYGKILTEIVMQNDYSVGIGKAVGSSNATISHQLYDLEKAGFITKSKRDKAQHFKLAENNQLKTEYIEITRYMVV